MNWRLWRIESKMEYVEGIGKCKVEWLHLEHPKYDCLMIYVHQLKMFFIRRHDLYQRVNCRFEKECPIIITEIGKFSPIRHIKQMFSSYSIKRKNGRKKDFKIFMKQNILPFEKNFQRFLDSTNSDIYRIVLK